MSSERAGVPWIRERFAVAALRLLPENGGEDISKVVERLLIIMESSERAGVHTSGALNREKAQEAVRRYLRGEYGPGGEPDLLDALEACVVPDPRLTRIEALVAAYDDAGLGHTTFEHEVRAILRGDQ